MKHFFRGLYLILTLDCEQSARMTSESFERRLSCFERCAVRLHNAFCRRSRRLERQLRLFHQAVRRQHLELDVNEVAGHLSPESRARIRDRLRNLRDEEPS